MIRWGDGIPPKNLLWIVPDKLAVCDCPGGYGDTRRQARLKEELIWIRKTNFDAVIMLMADQEMTQAYDSMHIASFELKINQLPTPDVLDRIYFELGKRLDNGQKLLVHRHNLDDTITAFMGCFLMWYGLADTPVSAEQSVNQIFERHISIQTRRKLMEMAVWRLQNPTGDGPQES